MKKLFVLLFISVACIGQYIKPIPSPNQDSIIIHTIEFDTLTLDTLNKYSSSSGFKEYFKVDTSLWYVVYVVNLSVDGEARFYIFGRPADLVVADTIMCIESGMGSDIVYNFFLYEPKTELFFLDGEPFKPKKIIFREIIQYNEQNN
jgi:hypothetical protein